MRKQHVAALGALRLHHRGEARKSAAALADRPRLVTHQIYVIGQDEGDASGFGAAGVAAPNVLKAASSARAWRRVADMGC